MLTNSKLAEQILPELSQELYFEEIDPQNAIAHNQAFDRPSTVNSNRNNFFTKLNDQNNNKLFHKINIEYYLIYNTLKYIYI